MVFASLNVSSSNLRLVCTLDIKTPFYDYIPFGVYCQILSLLMSWFCSLLPIQYQDYKTLQAYHLSEFAICIFLHIAFLSISFLAL
jgi:hypothetical protein